MNKKSNNPQVQMVDLKSQYLRIKEEIDNAIAQAINNTQFINGSEVKKFSAELAQYMNCKHVIPCANGTDALQLAMMALELEPGDEVIVPVHTYVATAEVIALLKLTPVFVDVDPNTFNIDITQLEEKVTSKTKAIVPVHLYGQSADMESIMKLAQKHNLYVIEDTAQAIGADYVFSDGKKSKAGTIGQIGCTSFFPSKNLGAYGDGGALFINDDQLAEKLRMVANHGQKTKYYHDIIGCNSRLDTIQAAILRVKLRYLNDYNQQRNKVAEKYDDAFKDVEQLQIPYRADYSTHVFHQYTLKVKNIDRDTFKNELSKEGIPSMIYYPVPLHLQKGYSNYGYKKGDFPISEKLSETVISLPMHTEMEEETQEYIIEKVKKTIG